MKLMLIVCLLAAAAVSVQCATLPFRSARELEAALVREAIAEAVAVEQLPKEEPAAASIAVPLVLVQLPEPTTLADAVAVADEQVLVPDGALKPAELLAVPEAIFVPLVQEAEVKIAAPAVADAADVPTDVQLIKESPAVIADEIVLSAKSGENVEAVAAAVEEQAIAEKVVEEIVKAVQAEPIVADDEKVVAAVVPKIAVAAPPQHPGFIAVAVVEQPAEEAAAVEEYAVRQAAIENDAVSTARPTLVQAVNNFLANNPLTNALQAIRDPSNAGAAAAAAADSPVIAAADPLPADAAAAAPAAPPARPTLIQQLQSNVANFQQNLQNQVQNVFQGGAPAQNAAGGAAAADRPNFIQQIQNAVGQAVNRPFSIFRPNAAQQAQDQKVTEATPVEGAAAAAAAVPAPTVTIEVVQHDPVVEDVADVKADDIPAEVAAAVVADKVEALPAVVADEKA